MIKLCYKPLLLFCKQILTKEQICTKNVLCRNRGAGLLFIPLISVRRHGVIVQRCTSVGHRQSGATFAHYVILLLLCLRRAVVVNISILEYVQIILTPYNIIVYITILNEPTMTKYNNLFRKYYYNIMFFDIVDNNIMQ